MASADVADPLVYYPDSRYIFDFHKTVYNHQPGKCRLVPGVDYGSEDMETLANGLTFITSGVILPSFSEMAKKYYRDHKVRGRIFLFDFNNPDKNAVELKITGDLNQTDFVPHGIGSWQDPSSGRLLIYVVNHGSLDDTIEKFEYIDDKKELKHLHTYKDPAIYFVNDVAVLEEEKFYFTNFAYFRNRIGGLIEALLQINSGYIVYFDGTKYTKVSDGYFLANGLALSLNKQYIYLCTANKDMKIFERKDNGELILKQVLMLHMDTSGSNATGITELFLDNGHTLYASSSASLYKNQLLIGTVHHKLMYCKVEIL
ncbi:hypothetical protein KUTeg_003922 [Tegillarca granosa]|uniref:Paraoxonase n=1 Tax=Tegillarca granosa TaxID=220873 RepID=A0ABQ9FNH5_TEGGR|nr:hypothetical protein KUTeg_003922 [Tegillarca granosa]